MKNLQLLFMMALIIAIASCEQKNSEPPAVQETQTPEREFYQLKTYTLDTDEQVEVTDGYLRDALLPGLKKLGIGPVGVFMPRPNEEDSTKKIWVLIPFSSLDQFLNLEELLAKDEAYVADGKNYINASHEQPPYQRVESTLMKAFIDMPEMNTPDLDGPRADRIYELRSYESPTEKYYRNKVDMFNAGGEVALFDKLDFNAVFYAEVISGSKMPNLMYMTTFANQESRDAHWDEFREAPEWKELSSMTKYQNSVSHSDKYFLFPTEYSDY